MFKLIRDVTKEECFWLKEDISKDTVVYECTNATYNACTDGVACTFDPDGGYPFFQLPTDALQYCKRDQNVT